MFNWRDIVKGIIKYVHHKSGKVIKYMASEDIEKDKEEFEHRKHNSEDNRRSKYIKKLDFEIEKITDNPKECIIDYALPQSSRIKYDQSIIEALNDGMKFKKVHRVVDWAIETYPDKEYYFELFAYEEDEKWRIALEILKNGKKLERYKFKSGKAPFERHYIEED